MVSMITIHYFFSDSKDASEYHVIKDRECMAWRSEGHSLSEVTGDGAAWATDHISTPGFQAWL